MPFLPTELAYRSPTGREPVEELPCDDQSTAVSLVLHINSPQNRPSFCAAQGGWSSTLHSHGVRLGLLDHE